MYQVHDVLELISTYMTKMCRYDTKYLIPFVNHACLYKNIQLIEACMNQIKLRTKKFILEAENFSTASIEVVKLIFSLDQLNIWLEIYLVRAMQHYLQVNPDARTELEDAIHNIRFLTMSNHEIRECQFLDTEIKDLLVALKDNPDLPTSVLSGYSKNRNPRSEYKLLSALPNNVVRKLYEIFNDRYCFLCKVAHSPFPCQIVLSVFKPFKDLNLVYNKYKHTCLERYSNDHIKSILETFNKLALDELYNKRFDLYDEFNIYPNCITFLTKNSPNTQIEQQIPRAIQKFEEGHRSVALMKKFYKMQQNREGTDCCFAFEETTKASQEKTKTRLIYAHKLILSASSSVFSTMLSEKWVKDDRIVIKDGSFNDFDALIKYIFDFRFSL